MSKHYFDAAEFKQRQDRARSAMQARGIDLLLVISPVNLNYLIGSCAKSFQKFQCLFFPLNAGPLTVLTRRSEVAEYQDLSLADDVRGWNGGDPEDPIDVFEKIFHEKRLAGKRIGIEMPRYYLSVPDFLRLRDVVSGCTVVDASGLVEETKFVKSSREQDYIRKAAELNDAGMTACTEALRAGATELEVAGEVYRTMARAGSGTAASAMNFASGERSCYAHVPPSERVIQKYDFVHVEFGSNYRQYCSTIGRQFAVGAPSRRMVEIFDTIRRAADACIVAMKPGVPAKVPHEAAKAVIVEAGMEEGRWHLTGYGVAPGFPPSWGESISLFGDCDRPLEAGMVLSVEPPVFLHKEGLGARTVDNVLITETGCEILSKITRDLIVVDR